MNIAESGAFPDTLFKSVINLIVSENMASSSMTNGCFYYNSHLNCHVNLQR